METTISVKAKIEVTVNSTRELSGFIDKAAKECNSRGFSSVEEAMTHSEKYGIHTLYYTAHAFFLGKAIVSSDRHMSEEKAIKQAIKLAKEYLQQ